VFARSFGNRIIGDIEQTDIEKWFAGQNWSPKTYNDALQKTSQFWKHAIKSRWAVKNPVTEIKRLKVAHAPVKIYTPDALQKQLFNLDFHHAIRRTLTGAGFRVTRIRKHDFHDCWEIRMERGPSMFDDSYAQIRRRIRRALRAEKLYSKFEGMEVGFQGNRLVVGFCSKLGAVGYI
jgi:hypothetical protein